MSPVNVGGALVSMVGVCVFGTRADCTGRLRAVNIFSPSLLSSSQA